MNKHIVRTIFPTFYAWSVALRGKWRKLMAFLGRTYPKAKRRLIMILRNGWCSVRAMRLRAWAGLFGLLLLAYILVYVGCAVNGEYSQRMYSSGKYFWVPGFPMRDCVIWMPAHIHRDRYGSNFLGMLFAPAIWLDRKYIHKDFNFVEKELAREAAAKDTP